MSQWQAGSEREGVYWSSHCSGLFWKWRLCGHYRIQMRGVCLLEASILIYHEYSHISSSILTVPDSIIDNNNREMFNFIFWVELWFGMPTQQLCRSTRRKLVDCFDFFTICWSASLFFCSQFRNLLHRFDTVSRSLFQHLNNGHHHAQIIVQYLLAFWSISLWCLVLVLCLLDLTLVLARHFIYWSE